MNRMVRCERDPSSHIARIVLDRPEHGNAFSAAMAASFLQELTELENDDAIKVIVIGGEGADLSIGADIGEMESILRAAPGGGSGKVPSLRARLAAMNTHWWGDNGLYRRLLHCRKITITLAHGRCQDAGLYLALFSDLSIADRSARFAMPSWRHVGAQGDISMLVAAVGLKRAKEFLYCGAVWDADKALSCGLVDEVVAPGDLAAAGDALATKCATIMRDAIAAEKHVVLASLAKMQIDAGFAMASVAAAWGTNIHFRAGEFNFLREARNLGIPAALAAAERHFGPPALDLP